MGEDMTPRYIWLSEHPAGWYQLLKEPPDGFGNWRPGLVWCQHKVWYRTIWGDQFPSVNGEQPDTVLQICAGSPAGHQVPGAETQWVKICTENMFAEQAFLSDNEGRRCRALNVGMTHGLPLGLFAKCVWEGPAKLASWKKAAALWRPMKLR